ncbi:S8 family peptidase [Salinibacter sp.]|uniref:S8 family peptidase n=1 Tax=Salinibacter sp. TaxID=2065818 RepID=UPI0021E8918B|nr:S8 family peptidase [Salinibacter sp.]
MPQDSIPVNLPRPLPNTPWDAVKQAAVTAFERANSNAVCGNPFGTPLTWLLGDCTSRPNPYQQFSESVGFAVAKDRAVAVGPAGDLEADGDLPIRFTPALRDRYSVTVGGVEFNDQFDLVKWSNTRPAPYVDVAGFAKNVVGVSGAGSSQYDTDFTSTAASASIGAGVASFLKAEMPALTGEDIEEILKRTARDAGPPGEDEATGTGAIDADAALSYVRNNDVQRSRQSVKSVISKKKIRSAVDLKGNRYWNFTPVGFQNCPVAQGDLYEFKARVPYSQTFSSTPDVWVRWGKSNGYNSRIGQVSHFNPLIEGVQVVDFDGRGLTIRGHYWEADFFDSWGRRCAKDQRIPKIPKNFNIAYTAVGTEGPPPPPPLDASLSGPTYLDEGEQGTWTAYTSRDGASYIWSVDQGSGWYQIGSGPSVSWGQDYISSTIIVDIKVEASKNGETASAQTKVTINNNGGGGGGGGGCNAVGLNRICLAASEGSFVLGNVRAETHTNGSIHVSWEAVGESDLPSEFALQHRADSTAEWSTLGTVPAGDSMSTDSSQAVTYRYRTDELEIGTHQFRVGLPQDTGSPLRAVGNSETSNVRRYTKPVTAEIAMDEAYRLSTYPNPVQQRASVELAVKERQNVSVRLYDLLGRRVATLHDGPLPAQELQRLRLDVSSTGFTSGTYFLRATGEDFATTEQITIVR